MGQESVRLGRIEAVGLISDTHGLLRPEAIEALAGCGLIVHAGDVGDPGILERLREIAPVVAVRGNVDTMPWPETAVALAGRLYVIHDLKQLSIDPRKFRAIVSGHSHKPGAFERDGVLYINPGAAGPRRFKLPVTVARLSLPAWTVTFLDLAHTPPRP